MLKTEKLKRGTLKKVESRNWESRNRPVSFPESISFQLSGCSFSPALLPEDQPDKVWV